MKYAMMVLVVGALGLPALAGDLPPVAASREELEERVDKIRASKATTVDKLRELEKLVLILYVVDQGKIQDIIPARIGDGVELVVCGIYGGSPRHKFHVPKAKEHLIEEWGKWDRLSWKVTFWVRGVNDLDEAVNYEGPDDLTRTENAGITMPLFDKAPGTQKSWQRKYLSYLKRRRWLDAWREFDRMSGKYWPIKATVTDKRRDQVEVVDEYGHQLWLTISDPQVLEAIEVKAAVQVGMTPQPAASTLKSFCAQKGRFKFVVYFWKIVEKEK